MHHLRYFYLTFVKMKSLLKILFLTFILLSASTALLGQDTQVQTQLKVKQLIDKKAEYNRLTNGEMDGYRIKIHFGNDHDASKNVRNKFSTKFKEYDTYEEYQLPNFVVLVGDFKSKLEAFESLKKIQSDFPNSFIVKDRIHGK